jgi:hypothetical protein
MSLQDIHQLLDITGLQNRLNSIISGSSIAFFTQLTSLKKQSGELNTMQFQYIKTTFKDTFAGIDNYCHIVNVKDSEKIYRVFHYQYEEMVIQEFPEHIKNLQGISFNALCELINTANNCDNDKLLFQIASSLPDELSPILQLPETRYLIINAKQTVNKKYYYEIQLDFGPQTITELGTELSEFSFNLSFD